MSFAFLAWKGLAVHLLQAQAWAGAAGSHCLQGPVTGGACCRGRSLGPQPTLDGGVADVQGRAGCAETR